MKALVLAAGRGSRMGGLTASRPKCLTPLAGRPLLFWQLEALGSAGADDIAVVCGYQGGKIRELAPYAPMPFHTLENPRWESTNMLSSLLCAADWAAGEACLISYSDIVYTGRHVQALISAPEGIALTYDRRWQELWSLRNGGNVLEDAESFRAEHGLLRDIGGRPQSLEQAQGQYMGLLKLNPEGWRVWLDRCRALGPSTDRIDMTSFLRLLLDDGAAIGAVPVDGAWCEVDNERDLRLYEAALDAGTFSHDWRH